MAIPVGSTIPPFQLAGSDGKTWSDVALRGRSYVLTFYPMDETPGCIAQMCSFRDAWAEYEKAGLLVFGVSRDSVASHETFVKKRDLPSVLLADEKALLHKALQIGRTLLGGANRVSLLVDANGVIRDVYQDNLAPSAHADRMLQAARAL